MKEYEKYRGFEECVAEIGAILTLAQIGVAFEPKNATYIAGWLEHAKTTHKDPLVEAIAEASRRSNELVAAYDKLTKDAQRNAA